MKKFEYKVEIMKTGILTDNNKKQETQLNEIGAQGWQLIQIYDSKRYIKYFFQREIQ